VVPVKAESTSVLQLHVHKSNRQKKPYKQPGSGHAVVVVPVVVVVVSVVVVSVVAVVVSVVVVVISVVVVVVSVVVIGATMVVVAVFKPPH
jgi:hypothetical protein